MSDSCGRRRILQTVGAVSVAVLAGCSAGGDGDDTSNQSDASNPDGDEPSENESSADSVGEDVESTLRTSATNQAEAIDGWVSDLGNDARAAAQQDGVSRGDRAEVAGDLSTFRAGDWTSLHVLDYESDTLYQTTSSRHVEPGTPLSEIDQPWTNASIEDELTGNEIWISEGFYQSPVVDTRVIAVVAQTNDDSRALVYTASVGSLLDRLPQNDGDQSVRIVAGDGTSIYEEADASSIDRATESSPIRSALEERRVQFIAGSDSLRAYAPLSEGGLAGNWVVVTSIPRGEERADA